MKHNEQLKLGSNSIDQDSELSVIKGSRGVAMYTEQTLHYSMTNPPTEQTCFAAKALDHEQAIELRDFLILHYPLEK